MKKRRAFSLLELLVAMALLALLAGFTVLNMRSAVSGADSRSLATLVAEHLRNARETSAASQQPVAVIFPTDLASKAFSQSLYLASGLSQAHVSRVFPFEREHRGAALFVGDWGAGLTTPPAVGFDVDQWLAPAMKKDFALVFTPEGNVTSNGFPFSQGAYQLVACAGGTASAGTPYFQATQLGRPWRISVSRSGQVQLSEGLGGAGPGVESRQGLTVSDTATPPIAVPLPACAPTGVGVTVMPTHSDNLPAGINTTVVAGQRLTLNLSAADLSGRDLYCEWACTPVPATPGAGHFSFPGKQKMTWDAASQRWTSSWDWVAPLNSQPGDQFRFQATLGDGLTALVVPQANQQILAIPSDQVYGSNPATGQVIRCNGDGTNPVTVANVSTANRGADVCPDGSKVLSAGPTGWSVYSGITGELLANATPVNYFPSSPALAPTGDRVAYWTQTAGGACQLYHSALDGSNPVQIVLPTILVPADFFGAQTMRWSPNGRKLAFTAVFGNPIATPDPSSLCVVDLYGPANLKTPVWGTGVNDLTWSPNSQYVYFKVIAGSVVERRRFDPTATVPDTWNFPATVPYQPFAISSDGQYVIERGGNFLFRQSIASGQTDNLGAYPFGLGPNNISIAKR